MTHAPRSVLLIAYHYPPCAMSSGVQRTLSFSIHLRRHGWHPLVLSVRPGAYDRVSPHQLVDIPSDVIVARTLALDGARHLAVRDRHWSRLTIPDRWASWWLTAVPTALALIRKHSVSAIWSTYPIATAHTIGGTLARLTGLPWIADFRDPMVEHIRETGETFPRNAALREARLRLERTVVERASRIVFCTGAAGQIVRERYPTVGADALAVIPNGYDEQAFRDAGPLVHDRATRRVLLHSGTVYPGADRDPGALFRALRALAQRGVITTGNFELRLRDPSNEAHFLAQAEREGVRDLVSILPPLPYREALAEMLGADALLVLQGYTSNPAVPAKLYEYLRARRPILGLVHPEGETAATLRSVGIKSMCSLTDAKAIECLLQEWLNAPARLETSLPRFEDVAAFSRESLAAQLAALLGAAVRQSSIRR